jgi:hypothetical protein
MTQNQENIVSMFETTVAFLDKNEAIWSARSAFAEAVTEAKAGVTAVREAAAQQESPTAGITDEKMQARIDLEEKALEIADQVAALAAKNSDVGLTAQVQVTRSSLDLAQDDNLVQATERIRDAATANITALKAYGVTADEVTALTNAIESFSGKKTAPRTAKASRSGATTGLANAIRTTRSIFRNQLDKLMTPFRRTNPDFYAGYFAARAIVNRTATKTTATPATSPPKPPATTVPRDT